MVARYSAEPDQSHLTAVKRIFGYLKGTQHLALTFSRNSNAPLVGYADADFARDIDDRKSTSGYIFMYGNSCISWYSGKQKCVSVSTSNAEYISLGIAIREALFLQQLFKELGCQQSPVMICEDNQATIAMTKNPVFHSKQKHIDVQHHFIREEVIQKRIQLQYCSSSNMLASPIYVPNPYLDLNSANCTS